MRFLFSLCLILMCTMSFTQMVELKPLLTVTGEAYEKVMPDVAIIHYRATEKILPQGQMTASQFEQDKLDIDLKFVDVTDEEIMKCVTVMEKGSAGKFEYGALPQTPLHSLS